MLVRLETYKIETGEIVATDHIVTDNPQRAMEMIHEGDDEDVKYHICDEAEERSFFASQMGKASTPATRKAARDNGKKGGRPPKAKPLGAYVK
jgi:hypothetical protein